jgi:hypothetical protein
MIKPSLRARLTEIGRVVEPNQDRVLSPVSKLYPIYAILSSRIAAIQYHSFAMWISPDFFFRCRTGATLILANPLPPVWVSGP